MGDCSVGDFLLVFLLLAILHNGLSDGASDKEVPIHRPGKCLQLFSKPTGDKGDTLIIGSNSKYESVRDVFPDYDIEKCAPMGSKDYNDNEYGTKIFKRSNSEHFDVPAAEQLHKVNSIDYFIHFGVQAFNCIRKKSGTEEFKRYVKIVNSMSSIEDNIREIKYYSGVSVSIEKCGGRKCIQVTETKCMADLEGKGLVQFKCDYDSQDTQRPANPPNIVPNERDMPLHWRREHPKVTLGYMYGREGEETMTVSAEGESFRIGINENPSGITTSSTTPPQQVIKVACQPPIILNTTIFHPECYQKLKNEDDSSFKDVLLDDTQFRKKFTVVDETVQICKEMKENGLPDSSPYARVLYRVQMTVIGKTKVNKITHGTGITELYPISLSDDAVTVQYTDVRFYDAITRTSVDNVIYKYVFPSQMVSTVSNSVPAAHRPSIDVEYKLWPEGMIYSTFISGEGYNLQVGSKPKLDIDIGTASCITVDYSSDNFKTELKIVAEKGGEIYAHPTENIDYSSTPIQQQSWRCEFSYKVEVEGAEAKRGYFTRVVNHLEIFVPVHTLQSYDGVEILRRPTREKYILEIFEVKYLLEDHLTPMRAIGKMSFAADRPIDTAHAMGQGFNAISKSEVHPRFISQIPKRAHNRNDYYRAGTINDHKTLDINENGHDQHEMRFTTAFMDQEMNDEDVKMPFTGLFVCKLGRANWMDQRKPYFEITSSGGVNDNNEGTQALNDEYFRSFTQKYWTCLKTGDATPKYMRITTKSDVIIKSDRHAAIKEIQFSPVDDVRLELLESTGSSDNSKYDITYEGVRYYRNDGQSRITNFDFGGYFILESTPSPNNGWTSGTINNINAPTASKETVQVDETSQVYYLDGNRGREYRFHLPGDQTSKEWQEKRMMRIGESYRVQQKIRPPLRTSLQCRENRTIAKTAVSDERLRTLVQTFKYSSQGNAAELKQTHHGLDTRVWECTVGQITILRVMNNILFSLTDVEKIRTILYSDGIAIFSGEKNNERMLEIAEVKFLNATDYTNLKYEGALEFVSSSENVGLHPILLGEPGIQDVNYILNDNEFSKTTFPAVLGDTLEIGKPHPGINSDADKEGKRFQDTMRCNELVSESDLPKEAKNVMGPKVILLQRQKRKKEILLSTITDLNSYFVDIKKEIWKCEVTAFGSDYVLYRVQTQMKLKPNANIQQIFHQNGVKIYEDKDRGHLIEIISYIEERTHEKYSKIYVAVKFEGLVIFPLNHLKDKLFMNDIMNSQNHLDKPIFQFSAVSRETGVTYLVQSQFHSTIDNSDGEIVTCEKYEDKYTAQSTYLQTEILVNENSNTQTPKQTWNKVDRTRKDHILYESYEMWSCKNQEKDFSRVVNKMLVKDNARVYYPDGVEVQRLIVLNGDTFMQIKHVRFFKSEHGENYPIKYIGRLQLERPSLPGLEKMLSSPPFNIQVIGKEKEEPAPYQPRYIFTWDSMRYAALNDLGVRSDGHNQSPPIKFSDKIDSLQTTFLNAKSSRILQLGRFWDEELKSQLTMKCYVYRSTNLVPLTYTISPKDPKTKYYPRVAEYIDQKLYILTQDEIDEIFNITSVRTWFCTDKTDEFIKVEANYETSVIPFAVRSTDGVEVKLEKVENEYLLRIKETVYINMMNSRVYKRPQNNPINGKQEDLMEFVTYPNSGGIGDKVKSWFSRLCG